VELSYQRRRRKRRRKEEEEENNSPSVLCFNAENNDIVMWLYLQSSCSLRVELDRESCKGCSI